MRVTKLRVCFLSLALLVFQYFGFAHAISHYEHHSPDAKHSNADHSDTTVCELCILHAQTGTGLLPSLPFWAPEIFAACHFEPTVKSAYTRFSAHYLSRAPPAFA